ncbi:hypothetical protein, partial [Porphyromonas uenonis]|uniref:hypothetical protein n=1 Tax=Porphyromonas uenonis TaxID=281920 RepID=UPI0005C741DC
MKNSSEESNETSEESNDTSEESKNKSEEFVHFLGSKSKISTEEFVHFLGGGVLFLKKVHSWGGVTEMVLGLFLLVLGVYSSV